MNVSTDTTGRAEAPADREPLTITLKPGALESLDMEGVKVLAEAVRTLTDVCAGLSCQPKFWTRDEHRNAAGRLLDCLLNDIGDLGDKLLHTAIAATPHASRDREHRAWCILQTRADYADELSEIAVDAVQALRDVENAKFDEAHLARTGKAVPS